MAIEQSRMADAARSLLDASALCAIATVSDDGSAHVNTAYFAFSPELDVVWMSDPDALHSRNIRARGTAAIAVYDSTQLWGRQDRGIQLFGSARELGSDARDAAALYGRRFSEFDPGQFGAYRLYAFHPDGIKLFDERELGAGQFVTARVEPEGRLAWQSTEVVSSRPR